MVRTVIGASVIIDAVWANRKSDRTMVPITVHDDGTIIVGLGYELPIPGCYLDGSRGHYIIRDVITLAVEYGYPIDAFAAYVIEQYGVDGMTDNYPNEALYYECDRAVAWLNENRRDADEGSWDFRDGDFGYWPDDEDEDDDA